MIIRRSWFSFLAATLRTMTVKNLNLSWWKKHQYWFRIWWEIYGHVDVLTGAIGGWPMKAPPVPISPGFTPPTTSPGFSSPPFSPTSPGFTPTSPGFTPTRPPFKPPTTSSFYTIRECMRRWRWCSIFITISSISSISACKYKRQRVFHLKIQCIRF